jgi:TetR/AcrR family transcriptional regulator, mexJK operon transcriptional repressor
VTDVDPDRAVRVDADAVGPTSSAQTRRFESPPSSVMSNAVSLRAKDSATISFELSGVTAMPLGKAIPSATRRVAPSGVTRAMIPGASPAPASKSQPPLTYKHFADKERLFSEIVTSAVSEAADPVYAEVLSLEDTGDIEADLRGFARRLLGRVIQPQILQLRRLVIGEAGRFPELGRTFYEQGPGRTIAALATAFEGLAARGALQLDDPRLAAAHFNWLVTSIPLNKAMFLGEDEALAPAELDEYADAGVRAFLAAYGQRH